MKRKPALPLSGTAFAYLAFPDQANLSNTERDAWKCACRGSEIMPGIPQNSNVRQVFPQLWVCCYQLRRSYAGSLRWASLLEHKGVLSLLFQRLQIELCKETEELGVVVWTWGRGILKCPILSVGPAPHQLAAWQAEPLCYDTVGSLVKTVSLPGAAENVGSNPEGEKREEGECWCCQEGKWRCGT